MKNWLKPCFGVLTWGLIIYGCAVKTDDTADKNQGGSPADDGGAPSATAGKSGQNPVGGEANENENENKNEGGSGSGSGSGGDFTAAAGGSSGQDGGAPGDGGAETSSAGDGSTVTSEPPLVTTVFGAGDVGWKEDFEGDAPDWSVTGGVWAIGKPKNSGGPAAFGGDQVAGTGLVDDYASSQDAYLISPEIDVPAAKENPRFRFQYWYELAAGDSAYVAIRVDGGGWQTLSTFAQSGEGAWRQLLVPLGEYADHTVQFGFRLYTNASATAPGLFIDDAIYETGAMSFDSPQGFEGGWDYWSARNGVWAFGAPTAEDGPQPFEGDALAGTILSGDYQNSVDSWLVGPLIDVPAAKTEPSVSLKYWYQLSSGDSGYVAISVDGGGWQTLSTLTGSGDGQWYNLTLPLSEYADRRVQLGFRLYTNGSTTAPGFYIDDVRYQRGFGGVEGQQGFEQGWAGWSSYNGVWAVGEPTADDGPQPHSGNALAGTVLSGDYEPDHDAWLVSPRIAVPKDAKTPEMSYWYWYELASGDSAYAAISVDGGGWQTLDTLSDSGGDSWRQKKIDLTSYKDHVVRIGFRLYTNGAANTLGYYIDDVAIDLK